MKYYLCLHIFLFLTHISLAQPEREITELIEKYKAIGLAVIVVKNNSIVYNKSFGYKNIEQKEPLCEADIFRIASISKSFSATAIMQLVCQKKLSLNDDISKLIGFKIRNPNFPETVITLKMLMSHRSSLNDSQGYFTLDVINPVKSDSTAKCYNNYEPGTSYQYCNLNFNIIGTVIERISGERFDQYIKHHILDPLQIYGGYCVDSLNKEMFVTLYEYDAQSEQFTPSPDAYNPRREQILNYNMGYSTPAFSPTGGMKISAKGLALYMMMHMNNGRSGAVRIISKKYAQQLQRQLSVQDGYGLAMMNTKSLIPGVHLIGHTGSAYGLYSAMFFNPKKKYGFVVITNGCADGETDGYVSLLKESVNVLYNYFLNINVSDKLSIK